MAPADAPRFVTAVVLQGTGSHGHFGGLVSAPLFSKVMQEAVAAARALAQPGDTVLLAPAAASMDCFRDYAERGDLFAEAVRALA